MGRAIRRQTPSDTRRRLEKLQAKLKYEKVGKSKLYEVLYGKVNIFMPIDLRKRYGIQRKSSGPKK